ncbi:hypothetical protein PUN28_004492 [Cardiocondyla obscurior]|uniref:Secreted protein n=1 Tax=Cardiocondyla obscurior TaxID=286306 RepID=A0AAW2GFQ1_9HYME
MKRWPCASLVRVSFTLLVIRCRHWTASVPRRARRGEKDGPLAYFAIRNIFANTFIALKHLKQKLLISAHLNYKRGITKQRNNLVSSLSNFVCTNVFNQETRRSYVTKRATFRVNIRNNIRNNV